mmetsp:Transcript_138/g.320  ORF Transcript_138/g.320 Transcript_138/m.320 type:complete len:318 (+) Transcript_138:975-1928(+)
MRQVDTGVDFSCTGAKELWIATLSAGKVDTVLREIQQYRNGVDLYLVYCGFDHMDTIGMFFQRLVQIDVLLNSMDIWGVDLDEHTLDKLAQVVSSFSGERCMKALRMSSAVGDNTRLFGAIGTSRLRKLTMELDTEEQVLRLANALKENCTLRTLDLPLTKLASSHAIKELCMSLEHHPSILSVQLFDSTIGVTDAWEFGRIVGRGPQIHRIDLKWDKGLYQSEAIRASMGACWDDKQGRDTSTVFCNEDIQSYFSEDSSSAHLFESVAAAGKKWIKSRRRGHPLVRLPLEHLYENDYPSGYLLDEFFELVDPERHH